MTMNNKLKEKLSENPNFLHNEFFMVETKELLCKVNETTGADLKYKTLRSWIYSYGFPKPMVRSEGRAKGVKGFYPRAFIEVISDILKAKEKGESLEKAIKNAFIGYEVLNYMSMMKYMRLLCEAYRATSITEDIEKNKGIIIEMINNGVAKNLNKIIDGLETMKLYEENFKKHSKQIKDNHTFGADALMYVNEFMLAEQIVKYYADTQVRISSGEYQQIAEKILNIINSNEAKSTKYERLLEIIKSKQASKGKKIVFEI